MQQVINAIVIDQNPLKSATALKIAEAEQSPTSSPVDGSPVDELQCSGRQTQRVIPEKIYTPRTDGKVFWPPLQPRFPGSL